MVSYRGVEKSRSPQGYERELQRSGLTLNSSLSGPGLTRGRSSSAHARHADTTINTSMLSTQATQASQKHTSGRYEGITRGRSPADLSRLQMQYYSDVASRREAATARA